MRAVSACRRVLAALAGWLLPVIAWAHGGHEHAGVSWQADAWVIVLLLVSTLAYMGGVWRLRQAGKTRVLGPLSQTAFASATAMLAIALLSPLDAYADRYFSAHMSQHLLLMLAAPPLMVMAQPAIAWLWCLPPQPRARVARWWAGTPSPSRTRAWLCVLLHPAAVWCNASLALWFWHLPRPYGWALAHEGIHSLEHATFFFTSLAFWYLLLAPRARSALGYGAALVYGVTFGMQNGFLGAILTFANHPFYAAHAGHAGPFGLSALEDQQLAGMIMWVPASLVHLLLLVLLAGRWLATAERRDEAGLRA